MIEADATAFRPSQPANRVFFSYALTMMPARERALDNAVSMLGADGLLGAVDFRLPPIHGNSRRARWQRAFWQRWFAHDGVSLADDLLPSLQTRTHPVFLHQGTSPVPYLPGCRIPYYVYVGRRP